MTTLREAAEASLDALKMMRQKYGEYDCQACDHADVAIIKLCAALEEPVQEPVAWMCADESLVHKGYSRFSRTCGGDWNIPVYTEPRENDVCERCEELAADKATWYRMAEMFANRLEELKKKGTE